MFSLYAYENGRNYYGIEHNFTSILSWAVKIVKRLICIFGLFCIFTQFDNNDAKDFGLRGNWSLIWLNLIWSKQSKILPNRSQTRTEKLNTAIPLACFAFSCIFHFLSILDSFIGIFEHSIGILGSLFHIFYCIFHSVYYGFNCVRVFCSVSRNCFLLRCFQNLFWNWCSPLELVQILKQFAKI